jgi:hypothetical protein
MGKRALPQAGPKAVQPKAVKPKVAPKPMFNSKRQGDDVSDRPVDDDESAQASALVLHEVSSKEPAAEAEPVQASALVLHELASNERVAEADPVQASALMLHAVSSKVPLSSTSEQAVAVQSQDEVPASRDDQLPDEPAMTSSPGTIVVQSQDAVPASREDQLPDEQAMTSSPGTIVLQPQDAILASRDDQLPDEPAMTSSPCTTLVDQAGMTSAQRSATIDAVDLDLEKDLEALLDAQPDGAAIPTDAATSVPVSPAEAFMKVEGETCDQFGDGELQDSADGRGGDDDFVASLQGAREFVAMFGGSAEDFLARQDADPNGVLQAIAMDANSLICQA